METRALPDLRLRQRNRHVRRGDLRGHIRLRRPHHPRRRVLPYLPRHRGYSHLHPPLQFCGLISFVAPPSARQLVSDPSMAHWPENGREALSPHAFPEDFNSEKESLWIYLWFISFSICILFYHWIIPALWRCNFPTCQPVQ